jgi:hypothetical protein
MLRLNKPKAKKYIGYVAVAILTAVFGKDFALSVFQSLPTGNVDVSQLSQ